MVKKIPVILREIILDCGDGMSFLLLKNFKKKMEYSHRWFNSSFARDRKLNQTVLLRIFLDL